MNNLKNKIVLITGATSGIGKAAADSFGGLGCDLILAAEGRIVLIIFLKN